MKTVIGLFDDREEGMRAYTALHDEGFALADLDILTNDDQDDVPKLENLRRNLPASDAEVYLEGVRQGGTIITANVADSAATRAAEIMSNFNMVVIRNVESSYKTSYFNGQVHLAVNHSSSERWSSDDPILIANSETYPIIDIHKTPEFPSTPKSNTQSTPYRFASSHR
jgi:hypothetical protein